MLSDKVKFVNNGTSVVALFLLLWSCISSVGIGMRLAVFCRTFSLHCYIINFCAVY